jgi:DNA-binding response OmpR family regulator
MRALLVCQDPDETAVLSLVLQRAGLAVLRSRDILDPIPQPPEDPLDLVILALTEGSPIPKIKQVRAESQLPLLVISESLDESTQVVALESGADLMVSRPFSARLLIAQTRALMRRAANLPFFTLPTLSARDVELDPGTHTVVVGGGSPRRLTQLEFRLLYTLMIHKEQVLPTAVLVEHVWGYTGEGERELVRGLVRRLRAKLEPDPHEPQYIITVPGIGYTFSTEA